MKKFLALTFMFIAFSSIVLAVTTGGFKNEHTFTTIAQALKMKHNTYVTIRGNITERVSGDKYVLKDSTGTIIAEIDDDKWQGQTYTQNDRLELSGEIERDFDSIKFDVSSVKKVPQ